MYGRAPRNTIRGASRVMRYYHRDTPEEKAFNAEVFTVPNCLMGFAVIFMCILNPNNLLILIPVSIGYAIVRSAKKNTYYGDDDYED
jgi:hypothetical protein